MFLSIMLVRTITFQVQTFTIYLFDMCFRHRLGSYNAFTRSSICELGNGINVNSTVKMRYDQRFPDPSLLVQSDTFFNTIVL